MFAIAVPMIAAYFPSAEDKQLSAKGNGASAKANSENTESAKSGTDPDSENVESKAGKFDLEEDKYREMVAGIWYHKYYGDRYLTISADGTATMDIYPDSFGQLMVGKYVHLDIRWDYADGIISFENVAGSPQASFDYINKTWGRESSRKLLDMNESTLRLLDESDGVEYPWKRVESIPQKDNQ